ncbi:alpha/beta hydrolase [Rhizobiaceae bacterium n13]|uniref:Alpha/beta hydrolase n=1 Tax=Ferirhizobium litorale TaxID=2927786 RepID=A0AAE3QIP9_9HYPH|nr:alpha/beta hydrolase [Fererhizobium litorale]MDI7863759.1 alpha/beta hydrolase [Fererhizobium litorale]MDI7924141.1 alpha/beta hydrolase [Fererhizobium litorale]
MGFSETRYRRNGSGATLAYHYAPAGRKERGILLISHGLAEHSKRYRHFAKEMSGRGYHVYAHDHRGHGETTAADAPPGRFASRYGIDCVIADLAAIQSMAVADHPRLPVVLLGHSMGGLIALNAAISYPKKFDALAIWNSNFNPGLAGRLAQAILRAERMLKGSDVPSAVLPKLTFGAWAKTVANRRTDFDWLSRDAEQVDRYVADPLCGFDASVSLWLDIFDMTFRAVRPERLANLRKDLPIHLVGGGQDPATDRGSAIAWLANHLKNAGFSNITVKIYQDMRHETLNEVGRDAAIAEFADWCQKNVRKS